MTTSEYKFYKTVTFISFYALYRYTLLNFKLIDMNFPIFFQFYYNGFLKLLVTQLIWENKNDEIEILNKNPQKFIQDCN
jgi:hypothetical protein